jgi:hypothetical protein
MNPEVQIAAGTPVDEALTTFRQSVNQPGTIFSTDHWLLPKLDQLQRLLTDPITRDEAQALLDVLYQRHWMSDLIEWLETRPASWGDFFTYRSNLKQEELRKRADERDPRRAAGLDPWSNFKLFDDDDFPKISDTCPDCGSSNWKLIGYGLPTEDAAEDARRGHFVLRVVSIRSGDREKIFLVRFPWGAVRVRKDEFWPLQSFHYDCRGSCTKAEDPEVAEDLACAAAMLAEFPKLVRAKTES